MDSQSKKILVLPYTRTLSHLSRPLAIACKLREKGYNLIFGGDKNSGKTEFIRKEGYQIVSSFEPDDDELFANIRNGKIKFATNSTINRMISSDLRLFNKIKPDLVLTDGRFSALVSTQIANIKHVAIVNASSTKYRSLPYIPFFKRASQLERSNCIRRFLDISNLKMEMFLFDNLMPFFKSKSKQYELKKQVTATNCLTGKDLTLLADIPEYFPTKSLPSDYHYIGPLTWKRGYQHPSPEWWPMDKKNSKLIYITMGTTGDINFFPKLYDAFKHSDHKVIMTTGGQVEAALNIPGEFYIEPYLDGDKIMEICDLVICHGGNGTIYQSLNSARPIIGIPTIPDQQFNMRRVESLGTGILLSPTEFIQNPDSILNVTNKVFSHNEFYKRASEIQKILHGYKAEAKGTELIEQLLHNS